MKILAKSKIKLLETLYIFSFLIIYLLPKRIFKMIGINVNSVSLSFLYHFGGYLIFSFIILKAFERKIAFNKLIVILSSLSVILEILQTFVGRKFEINDIILNILGLCIALLVYLILNLHSINRNYPYQIKNNLHDYF